jgi:hypothetical protein
VKVGKILDAALEPVDFLGGALKVDGHAEQSDCQCERVRM